MVIGQNAEIGQPPELDWREEGVPVSRRFGDTYFSRDGGLDEARHVFFAGNDLPARLNPGFSIAETGFGTGRNLLLLDQVWQGDRTIRFTSFEAFPLSDQDLARAHAHLALPQDRCAKLRALLAQGSRFRFGAIEVEIIIGDARETLPTWKGSADAWFLDGFAPARNPELWQDDLLGEVARHTNPNGTFATYSAAGSVRQALENAGFQVERRAGFGKKKHMTRGVMP